MGKTVEKPPPSFVDRARARGTRSSLTCCVCKYLAELPDGYREEVLTAMMRPDITTTAILHILETDGHDPPGPGVFKRHRSGNCQGTYRREMLGELDGVLRR